MMVRAGKGGCIEGLVEVEPELSIGEEASEQ